MYKTSAETEERRASLITVEMNDEKDNVDIYVRNAMDCKIMREANIDLSPEGFIDLVSPILQAKGYKLEAVPGAV